MGPGVSNLWSYFLGPPAQNSILIYNDGTVVERAGFENDEIQDPSVYLFILGGTIFRTSLGSFAYNALTAAGYGWEEIPDFDTYAPVYTGEYP